MYASMSTVRGAPDADVENVARMAGEAMLSWLRAFDGYRGLLVLADEEARVARILTFWDSAEDEERTRGSRLAIRDKLTSTAGFEVVGTEPYEVQLLELDGAG